MHQEDVSAFVDGELSDGHVEVVMGTLRQPAGFRAWCHYHMIGDILRAPENAVEMNPDFGSRFAARLKAEPTIVVPGADLSRNPAPLPENIADLAAARSTRRHRAGLSTKRLALPGLAAALAAATAAFFSAPALMVAHDTKIEKPAAVAAVTPPVANGVTVALGHTVALENASAPIAAKAPEAKLRDASMEEYVTAHQRFSPFAYGTSEFQRSEPAAADAAK
ncbi:MAG: sigma-E factor negative regulatory protein [Burkholderiaceae bacterium]